MSWFVVDVEGDGPVPPLYSMVCFGVVKLQEDLENAPTFYGQTAPITEDFLPDALAVSGFSREEHEGFEHPRKVMIEFDDWLSEHSLKGRPKFISDNNGYDWQWINYYFYKYVGDNPFGFSSGNIGQLYKGGVGDMRKSFKHLRETRHTHHPVDDARGNAEALLKMRKSGLKFIF